MPDTPPTARSTGPPSAEDTAWLAHAREEQQKAPERIENAAKYLAGIIAISLTIFLDKRPEPLGPALETSLHWAAFLWMGAAVLSFFVLFPWRYRYHPDSPEDIRRAFTRVVRVKRTVLLASVVCYLIALGLGVWVYLGS